MTLDDCTKDVVGFEGIYKVNILGEVFNNKGKKLKPCKDKFGYLKYCLYKGKPFQKKIHRIVAEAFIPNPLNKRVVNHIDGNKENNAIWNLEWTTDAYNSQHARDVGLTETYLVEIVETGQVFNGAYECARAIGGDASDIHRCLIGKTKTHKGYHFRRLGRVC